MADRVYTMLGFAQRAGGIASGETAVSLSLRRGLAKLLVMAEDASENTRRRLLALADACSVECISFGTRESLGRAVGKSPRSALAIEDARFARTVRGLLREGKLR